MSSKSNPAPSKYFHKFLGGNGAFGLGESVADGVAPPLTKGVPVSVGLGVDPFGVGDPEGVEVGVGVTCGVGRAVGVGVGPPAF